MSECYQLPIYTVAPELAGALRRQRRLIITAPTGSGKSTQVPQMLLDQGLLGDGRVVVLQPRRLAARLLAARVAQERGVKLGMEVGYQIRFDDVSGPATRIKFETEGILLRQMIGSPSLDGVSAIIFDEFHERHIYGDITLAQALRLQATRRPDLQLIVMSATLDSALLQKYLEPCALLHAEGRTFPVEYEYADKPVDFEYTPAWEAAVDALERLDRQGRVSGDVLVFMPGAYEISRTIENLRHSPACKGAVLLPLHGELPPQDQDAAVARYDRRKIVVATNVAETSLTIDGIRVVIDCGLARVARFDPYRGINTLLIEKISRASAEQRAGRAGRTAPGICARLWTEREHAARAAQDLPEIKRVDLAEVVLTLKTLGVDDLRAFAWLEPPESRSLDRALSLLEDLGALDHHGAVTEVGRRMLSFPVHPRYARMLLAAAEVGAVRAVSLIAALTQGRPVLLRRQGKETLESRHEMLGDEHQSDLFLLMRAWQFANGCGFQVDKCRRLGIHAQAARQAGPLWEHFLRIARNQDLPIEERAPADEAIMKCVLAGFSDQLARRLDKGTLRCRLVHGRKGELVRDSVAREAELIVATEIQEIGRSDGEIEVLLSQATAVKEEWLRELFPGDFNSKIDVGWERAAKRVAAMESVCFRDLPLRGQLMDRPPAEDAARILADMVLSGEVALPLWDHAVDQWALRLNQLAQAYPDWGLPPITPEDRQTLLQQICLGCYSAKDLKDQPVWPVVKSWLNPAQHGLLDKHMPERVVLSNGRNPKVVYSADGPPHIACRIQELFGVTETPRIAGGKIPLLVHILAPSHRPVQVTQDLAGFWREHYPRVKKELQRKYPKHEWR